MSMRFIVPDMMSRLRATSRADDEGGEHRGKDADGDRDAEAADRAGAKGDRWGRR